MTEDEALERLKESPLKKFQEVREHDNLCRCDKCNYERDCGLKKEDAN